MKLGERIDQRRKEIGISQAELARRVGIRQSTMHSLIKGDSRSSRAIVQIARELGTTPAYLTGEIDDPDAYAPHQLPARQPQYVLMAVALPSERALARMFEALLEVVDRTAPVDEQALLLAQMLPTGLSQLRDLLPEKPVMLDPKAAPAAAPAELATSDRSPR